ncbi:LOW QUALITY PROTEIN: protein toll-like [Lingula anatina]|uniref:LOW QUALITY PROTEIN: protein toll-like n=1 Tax=Lingula anatina TaxID=7574 RepID=A0A1S3H5N1_LINAN|nr:LOW QUALITY PROTEIN: protein toll-like [Lingula anatina]|eukprot:XP_013380771.1 LOW QUALITY PROTEIN: protein toll-like [Lingula anatina]
MSAASSGCRLNSSRIFSSLEFITEKSLIVLRLQCRRPTLVLVEEQHPVSFNENLLLYVLLSSCHMSWRSLSRLGKAGDLQVLTVDALSETELGESAFYNDTTYDGLSNLSSLSLEIRDGATCPLPKILTTYTWPRLAELYMNNIDASRLPAGLDVRLPKLQSLTIRNAHFSVPPVFPWDNETLTLPRNLSRATFLQGHEHKHLDFPTNIYLRKLSIARNRLPQLTDFKFRGSLLRLELNDDGIEEIGGGVFSELHDLQYLDLSGNQLSHLPPNLLKSQVALRVLDLHGNNISSVSHENFETLTSLIVLKLNKNNLVQIRSGTFSGLRRLQFLHLDHNKIHVIEHGAMPTASLNLEELYLQNNLLHNIPEFLFDNNNIELVNMTRNVINFNDSSRFFDDLGRMLGITSETPKCASSSKRFDLRYNDISSLPYSLNWNNRSKKALAYLFKCFKLDMSHNNLHCDCNIYELYNVFAGNTPGNGYLNEDTLSTLSCETPTDVRRTTLIDMTPAKFNCKVKVPLCPPSCDCYRQTISRDLLVDCSNRSLTALPDFAPKGRLQLEMAGNLIEVLEPRPYLANATKLILSNNAIQTIDPAVFGLFAELRTLHLDGNHLTHLPKEITSVNISEIKLDKNYLSCDCKSTWLKRWLNENGKNIPRFTELTCAVGKQNGQRIIDVPDSSFTCDPDDAGTKSQLIVPIAICLAVVLVILAVNLIVYRFSIEIKVLVYNKFNWHPFDRVDDDGPEKIFDAFVSYSSQDYKWVVHNLRHTMENHVPPYRLCVHDRDFIVGETIFDNIMNSVQQSKRMIMVLSQNYVDSEWCMMEFRTAHQKVLKERSKYLIIILFDDVNKDQLDEELLAYLNTSTYLEVSSKWFWKKLFYAMPDLSKRRSLVSEHSGYELNFRPDAEEGIISNREWTAYKKH